MRESLNGKFQPYALLASRRDEYHAEVIGVKARDSMLLIYPYPSSWSFIS